MRPLIIFCLVLAAGTSLRSQPQVPSRMQFADITLRIRDDARKEIQEDVDKLTRNPKFFNIYVQRARTYFPIIERIFREENVPDEFKYLVIQESALIPDAVSSSNAVGFWQFKDFTAKEMGLRVDRFVDERKNIVSSSRAAARYIKKNNNRFFDNWLIALQAYQMGPGGALNAGGARYKGQKSMTIDRKTYWYIKKYLAHKVAFENALNGPAVISVAEYWKGADKSLRDISRETGVSESEIESYNKWLERGKIPSDKQYAVIIPVKAAEGLPASFGSPELANTSMRAVKKSYAFDYQFSSPDAFPKFSSRARAESGMITKINGRKAIVAKAGDRAASLATKGDISLGKFYRFNDLKDGERVQPGEIYYLQRKKSRQSAIHHVVRKGETFWSISQKYGIKMKKLLTRNRLREEVKLNEGRILWLRYIRPRDIPVEFVKSEPQDIPVLAKPADRPKTLEKSSDKSAGAAEIAEHNLADSSTVLFAESSDDQITLETERSEDHQDEEMPVEPVVERAAGQGQQTHVVSAGETLYSISRQYSVKIDDLLKWNGIEITDPLAIDQELILYPSTDKKTQKNTDNSELYYTVESGDTLYGISRKFNLTVDKLKELNNKSNNLLKEGERLRVR